MIIWLSYRIYCSKDLSLYIQVYNKPMIMPCAVVTCYYLNNLIYCTFFKQIPTTRPAAKSTTRRTKNPSTQPAISVSTPSSRSSSLAPTSRAVPVNINTKSTQSSNTTAIIVSVLVSLFLLVAVVVVVLLCRRRKRYSNIRNISTTCGICLG